MKISPWRRGKALDGYTNYYNVPEGVEPALFVKQYESVTLKELWPGIDLRCYSTDGTCWKPIGWWPRVRTIRRYALR
jgi:hypothetical protein